LGVKAWGETGKRRDKRKVKKRKGRQVLKNNYIQKSCSDLGKRRVTLRGKRKEVNFWPVKHAIILIKPRGETGDRAKR